MTIYLIRHGQVDFHWEKKLNSKDYDQAWSDYDHTPIKPITRRFEVPEDAKIFTTSYKRTQDTARQYLGREDFTVIPDGLADEVPLVSYKDTDKPKRVWRMDFRGRLQWYTHGKRQPEWRRNSLERAYKLIDYLEAQDAETVVVVFHGFFLRTVSRALRKRGYKQEGRPRFAVPNLLTVKAVKP
ncbi:MAG: histidine phosphatase family protein [Lachnospiraceae bacterium]|nr:histidine phosphatase family protein [Lachnospiraceae bacterium]